MSWTVAVMAAMAAQAATPDALAPAGEWTAVAQDAGECLLSRQFGSGDTAISLGFLRMPTVTVGDVLLTSPGGRAWPADGKGRIVIRPLGKKFATRWTSAPRKGEPGVVTTIDPTAEFWTALPVATALTIHGVRAEPVVVPTGAMAGAIAALDACMANVLRGWGGDPAASVAPGPWLTDWFGRRDYPVDAVKRGAQGRAVALVAVDMSGRPSRCRIVRSSGHVDLDDRTCAITAGDVRAPRAKKGSPSTRWLVMDVRWILPD